MLMASRIRLRDRLGLVSRLLLSSLLAMLLAVAAVQWLTLRSVQENGLAQAKASLAVSMAMLRHEVAPLGNTWKATSDGALLLGTAKLNGRNDVVDAVKDVSGASATIFLGDTRIATNVRNADGSRGVGTKLAAGPARDSVIRDGHAYTGFTNILGQPYLATYEPIVSAEKQTIGILFVGVPYANAEAFIARITRQALLAASVVAVLAGLAFLWALRASVRPLRDLTSAMRRIAEGDLSTDIPGTARRDAVGAMANALLVFKEHMRQEKELTAAQEEQRQRAEVEKRTALAEMADKIEEETSVALREVSARTSDMATIAEEMSASASRTGNSALAASTASSQALENAQTVASAAEELAASIREIGSQVAQSSQVVGRAVAAGGEARTTIGALNEEVTRIGVVADMIGEIAAKTNLLALNATIEAARAGDAGKGFAVVASEVKTLATQTARSTEEIGKHIAQVRDATGASVAAVARIEQTIGEVSSIAGSIAAAVEEQQAATAEIARNVSETAAAANQMTSRTAEVSTEADNTGKHAAEVRENTVRLDTAVSELRHSVIRVVRTSTTEVDRRISTRYSVDLPCHLSIAGQSHAARVTDISEHGAAIRGAPSVPSGTRGMLQIDAVGQALSCVVRGNSDDTLHMAFERDAGTSSRIRPIVERLGQRRAA
ncbi:MAG TPA: cache domain-containing protein [Acetobacteraceae bacterium]|nr:cache domain-containing protein [Acetobacteraceae bacterium]